MERKRLVIDPVIVVEGRDDTDAGETNGSAIDEETIALIQKGAANTQ